jgi:hypothetical protein
MEYIALDVHKNYTWARVENSQGERLYESRLAHAHGTIKNFVNRWSGGSPVAVETVGNWYWSSMRSKPEVQRLSWSMLGWLNS